MKTRMSAQGVALLVLGAIAALHAQPAAADVPTLDFPAACIASLRSEVLDNAPAVVWSGQASLPVFESDGRFADVAEPVSLWRVGCGGSQAALQLRLGQWSDPLLDSHVSLPRLSVRQGLREVEIAALRLSYPSPPQMPVAMAAGARNASPGMFVLDSAGKDVNLNGALTLVARHPVTGAELLTLDIPAHVPEAPSARPINGRYTGNFFDPLKPGEGIVVEIVDLPEPAHHYLQFSWMTFDNDGRPFWISGGGDFHDGDSHLHMPAIYRSGGRFGGRKAADRSAEWGSIDLEFADCNTLHLGYAANSGLPSQVPGGKGELQWLRLTGVSGYRCD